MYIGFQLIPDINFNFYILQIVTFLVGIIFYIPLSTLMSDLTKQ